MTTQAECLSPYTHLDILRGTDRRSLAGLRKIEFDQLLLPPIPQTDLIYTSAWLQEIKDLRNTVFSYAAEESWEYITDLREFLQNGTPGLDLVKLRRGPNGEILAFRALEQKDIKNVYDPVPELKQYTLETCALGLEIMFVSLERQRNQPIFLGDSRLRAYSWLGEVLKLEAKVSDQNPATLRSVLQTGYSTAAFATWNSIDMLPAVWSQQFPERPPMTTKQAENVDFLPFLSHVAAGNSSIVMPLFYALTGTSNDEVKASDRFNDPSCFEIIEGTEKAQQDNRHNGKQVKRGFTLKHTALDTLVDRRTGKKIKDIIAAKYTTGCPALYTVALRQMNAWIHNLAKNHYFPLLDFQIASSQLLSA